MALERVRITVEEVAADPTNAHQVTVHGDAAIETLTIHGDEDGRGWVYVKYANGGSSSGTPKHWASYVRYVEDDETKAVREFYGDAAAELVNNGWTVGSAVAHVTGTCDIEICTGDHTPRRRRVEHRIFQIYTAHSDESAYIECTCGHVAKSDTLAYTVRAHEEHLPPKGD